MTKKNRPIRILHTPARFYPYIGGVENHIFYLSKELVKAGYEVEVICSDEPRDERKNLKGVIIKKLPYRFKIANTNITLGLPQALLTANYDIAHSHMPTPWTSDLTMLIGRLRRKKCVITIHNDMDKPDPIGKLITWLYLHTIFRLTLKLAHKIIIVNPDWQDAFKKTANIYKKVSDKVITIPNGVDDQLFSVAHKQSQSNVILFVSILDTYHRYKGLEWLLGAMPRIINQVPDAKLVIIGGGELVDEYKQKCRELEIEPTVTFLGAKSQLEVAKQCQQSKVFILPSTEIEGFGIVLLEAMACGIPVITTDVAGLASKVRQHNTGTLIKKRDSGAIAKAVSKYLLDDKLRIESGSRGRKLVVEEYGWHSVALQIELIYEGLME